MKIVLLQDVRSLDKAGMLVEVLENYACSLLLPKKLGVTATAENLSTLKLKQTNEAKIAAKQLAETKALTAEIEVGSVTMHIKSGENNKTYDSISTKELAEAVKEQLGLELDKEKITPAESVKNFGNYKTVVKLYRNVQATPKVNMTETK